MTTSAIFTALLVIAAAILYFLRCAECVRLNEQHERAVADIEAYKRLGSSDITRFFITSSRFGHPGMGVYINAPECGKSLMILNINTGDPALDRLLAKELFDKINEIESYNDDAKEEAAKAAEGTVSD